MITPTTATVTAPNGSTVNMRAKPKAGAALVERVPIGETVIILEPGSDWTKVEWNRKMGWMMDMFLDYNGEEVKG